MLVYPLHALPVRHPVEGAGVHHHPVVHVCLREFLALRALPAYHLYDRDLDGGFPYELEIPLVVGRNAHDDSRAVFHEDVAREKDRYPPVRRRIDGIATGEEALLRELRHFPLLYLDPLGAFDEPLPLILPPAPAKELRRERVVDGYYDERGSVYRVDTGREAFEALIGALDGEHDFYSFAPPDPILLHDPNALGPFIEFIQVIEQPVGVIPYSEEPLLELLELDLAAAPLAFSAYHLFVGEHRLARRAPVDRCLFLVGQSRLEEPHEQPLRPPVVVRLAGCDLAGPVVDDPPAFELGLHVCDILFGPDRRMGALLDRRVLGGQPE